MFATCIHRASQTTVSFLHFPALSDHPYRLHFEQLQGPEKVERDFWNFEAVESRARSLWTA